LKEGCQRICVLAVLGRYHLGQLGEAHGPALLAQLLLHQLQQRWLLWCRAARVVSPCQLALLGLGLRLGGLCCRCGGVGRGCRLILRER